MRITKQILYSFFFIIISLIVKGQPVIQIPLAYSTEGYANSATGNSANVQSGNPLTNDVFGNNTNATDLTLVPAIKGELNVSDAGALTYTVPIDVIKGVNNFQPILV